MKKQFLYLVLLGLLCSIGNVWADTTLFDVDFSAQKNEDITTSSGSAVFVAKTYSSYNMSMGIKSGKPIKIIDSGLEFSENNYNSYTCLAIPLTLTANKKVTATITLASSGKVKYNWASGNLPSTPNAGSGTAYSTASTTNTLEYTPTSAGNYVLYLGRNGSNDGKVIKSIVITQETSSKTASSASFTVTAPSITLPGTSTYMQSATTADGYDGVVSYELSNNTCGATIEGTTVTVTKAGSVKVTATAPETTNFDLSTASYTLTVTDPRTVITGAWSSNAPIIEKNDANPTIPAFSITTEGVTKGTQCNVSYSIVSDEENIISVDDNGISGLLTSKEATATVRATVTVASGYTNDYVVNTSNYDCVITVCVFVDPTITFNTTTHKKGGSALDLSKLFTSNSSGEVTYSVVDAGGTGATISDGKFSASAAIGIATIQASQIAAGGYNAKAVTTSIYVTNADWVGQLSSFTRENDTYTFDQFPEVKVQDKKIYIEIPSASIAGSVYFKGSGAASDRHLYIYKTNGTVKDETRGIEYKKAYESVDFTDSDILTENGKYYLVFGTGDDYKAVGAKYTISSFSGTISASGWNTFSASCPLDLESITGGTAYVASAAADGNVTLTTTTEKVAAETGLMIKGTVGATFTISTTSDDATFSGANLLVGLPNGGTVVKNDNNYVFGWSDPADPGFYLVNDAQPVLGAGKAYLHTAVALAPGLRIVEGENNATDTQCVENSSVVVKFIENGQLLIKRDGIVYDAMGHVIR